MEESEVLNSAVQFRIKTTIVPLDIERTRFDCLLTLDARDYILHLVLPNYPSCSGCEVSASWELGFLLKECTQFHHEELQCCATIDELISKITPLIVHYHAQKGISSVLDKTKCSNYSEILKEIELIGWDNLLSVNQDFTELKLRVRDVTDREHVLSVKLAGPIPQFTADYPKEVLYEWRERSTLKEVYDIFCKEAEHYLDFWEVMDALDRDCWVLEPENPSRKDTYRKIAVTPNVSLKIDVDPKHPRLFPTITWLGSEAAVFSLREKVLMRIELWEADEPIHVNLQRLLEIDLPTKESGRDQQAVEEYEVTCCICYSARLDGEVPSRTCDNPQCGQSFHIFCLYEWLRGLTGTTRTQGNKVFGDCPYCEHPISCRPPVN